MRNVKCGNMAELAPYKIFYWGIPFRGNFPKLLLSYKGVGFEEASVPEVLELKNAKVGSTPAVFFAPPLLYDRESDLYMSQTGAIMMYLGGKLGMVPSDVWLSSMQTKVMNDASDVLGELSRNNGSQMWNKEAWDVFMAPDGRFVKWLSVFETQGAKCGLTADGGFYLGTPAATVADVVVLSLFGTMARCLPKMAPMLNEYMPRVMALVGRLSSNAGVAAFFERQGTGVYCGGQIEASIKSMLD